MFTLKTSKIFLITILLCLFTTHAKAETKILAVLSTQQSQETTLQQINHIRSWLFSMPKGGSIVVLDGWHGNRIATLTRPTKESHQSPKTIILHNRQGFAQLVKFAQTRTKPIEPSGSLHLPRLMSVIAQNYPDISDIVLLGSVSLNLPEAKNSISREQYLPADSNLVKSSSDSLFGTSNVKERLKGKRIHWLLPNNINSYQYAQDIERFYHLYLHLQSAQLITLSADAELVKSRLLEKASPLPMAYQIGKASTHPIKHIDSLFTRRPSQARAINLNQKQRLKIGISWSAPVDLDIYTYLDGEVQPVYYANPRGSHGATHHKDVTQGDPKTITYEIISFGEPIFLCDLHIAVNHYSGSTSKDIEVGLRIEIGESLTAKKFHFSNTTGNSGKDTKAVLRTGKSSAHTKYFSLTKLLNISGCVV